MASGFCQVFLMDFNVILAQIRFILAWSIFDQIEWNTLLYNADRIILQFEVILCLWWVLWKLCQGFIADSEQALVKGVQSTKNYDH